MTEPAEHGIELGPLVPSPVVAEVFWAMDHPDEEGDEGCGDRNPRRPLDSPPSLGAAEAEPNGE